MPTVTGLTRIAEVLSARDVRVRNNGSTAVEVADHEFAYGEGLPIAAGAEETFSLSGGEGLYAVTATLPAPAQSAPSTSATGGTLAAATYYYVVTATNAQGETVASGERSQVTTGATSKVTVNWNAVAGATGYRIYRGTAAGAENRYFAVGAVTTFDDVGGAGTAGTPPAANSAYGSTDVRTV